MWMRYRSGDCAIAIRTFKWCPKSDFYCQSHFCQNRPQPKAIIHDFFMILGQNSTYWNMDIVWKPYSCWSQWCKSHFFANGAVTFLPKSHLAKGYNPWFFSLIWVKIQPTGTWTMFESPVHADHNGANPSFISHFQPKIPSIVHS